MLFVVPTAARRQAIIRWALAAATQIAADPTFIWVTTRPDVNEYTLLTAPIWQVAGGPARLALVPPSGNVPVELRAAAWSATGRLDFGRRPADEGGEA